MHFTVTPGECVRRGATGSARALAEQARRVERAVGEDQVGARALQRESALSSRQAS